MPPTPSPLDHHPAAQQIESQLPSPQAKITTADSVKINSSHDQADYQASSEMSITPISSAQKQEQEQAFEDADAVVTVLGIPELLLLIIAEVPLDCRTSIRRVSKTWQAAVEKVGHTLDPVSYGFFRYYDHKYLRNPNLPLYPPEIELSPNLALGCHGTKTSLGLRLQHWSYALDFAYDWGSPGRPGHIGRDHEFTTNPPVTQLVLSAGQDDDARVANLRVPGGIEIGDLRHYLSKMVPEENLGDKCAHFSHRTESYAALNCVIQRTIRDDESGDSCEWVPHASW